MVHFEQMETMKVMFHRFGQLSIQYLQINIRIYCLHSNEYSNFHN